MADVTVTLGAKDEGLSGALRGVGKDIGALKTAFASLGLAAASIGAAKMAFDAFKGMADYAGQVSDLAAQTGLSAQETMVWGQALKNAGLGADALQGIMNRLQKAMTGVNEQGEPTNKAFEKLGISISALRSMTPDQQLQTVKDAIAGIPDPANRAAIAMEIFGKSGGKALSLFTDGKALDTARQQLGDLAKNLGANIESLDKLSDALNAAGELKSLQFMAGFATGFSGDMEKAADALNKMDFSKAGQEIGFMARGAKDLADQINRMLPKSGGVGDTVKAAINAAARIDPMLGGILGIGDVARSLGSKGKESYDAEKAAREAQDARNKALDSMLLPNALPSEPIDGTLGSSLSLMTDINSISESNLSLQDSYSASILGSAEQMSIMVDSQKNINDASEKGLKLEQEKLSTLKSQASERLAEAKSQLQRMAEANVPEIGARGSMARAAKKALGLEKQAQQAEDFGETDKAQRLRDKASELRGKAFGGEDKVTTLENTVTKIESTLAELAKRLPTPALSP
jgi:hypothetical protein